MTLRKGFGLPEGMEYTPAVRKADGLGFDFVEIIMDGGFRRKNVAARRDEIASTLYEHDIELTVHLPMAVDIGSPYDTIRAATVEELKKCIELAADLGAQKGVLHPSSVTTRMGLGWSDDDVRQNIIDSVDELTEFASGLNFEICAENLPNSTFTLENFDTLLNKTSASMTLDTGHARLSGFSASEIGRFVEEHLDELSHVHLNDNRMELNDRSPQDEHLPLGAGTIDFDTILSPIVQNSWDGTLALEIATWNLDYIQASKTYLDRIVG